MEDWNVGTIDCWKDLENWSNGTLELWKNKEFLSEWGLAFAYPAKFVCWKVGMLENQKDEIYYNNRV